MSTHPEAMTAIAALPVDGDVVIIATPEVARAIALAWRAAYTGETVELRPRPGWGGDVDHLMAAAAMADVQAGRPPATRPVALVRGPEVTAAVPRLGVVR